MAKVVWPCVRHAGCVGCVGEGTLAPVESPVAIPWRAVGCGEDEIGRRRAWGRLPPRRKGLGEWCQQPDGSCLSGFGRLELAERDRPLDEDRALADVVPAQAEGFAWTQSGVGEHRDQRCVELPNAVE